MDNPDPNSWLKIIIALLAVLFLFAFAACLTLTLRGYLPKASDGEDEDSHLLPRAVKWLSTLSAPWLIFTTGLAKLLLLLSGHTPQNQESVTEDEVKDLIEQGTEEGTFEKTEQAMVDNIFHMSDQTIYALMTPRPQMLWLDLADPLKHNLRLIRETAQTVFPVGRDSLDDFCGVLYAKELLDASLARKPLDLAQYIHKPIFVPRSMETFRVLEKMKDSDIHEAMVLDEYGGVVGFVTLTDILEEIIGDTIAAGEPDLPQLTIRDDHSWLVDGLYSIDDFKERFDIEELPDEDHDHYQTMGGFLTSYFGYIPKVGEKKDWQHFTFEVLNMDRARVDKILITEKRETSAET